MPNSVVQQLLRDANKPGAYQAKLALVRYLQDNKLPEETDSTA